MDQLGLPFDEPRRTGFSPVHHEPAVWVRRLLLLKELKLDAVIRDIALRRGLNILWARPGGPGEARLNEGRLSGHTAGKTTFCRLIRYVLGEERFAAPRVQERVRTGDLRDGWVVAEVVVGGQPWVVGRPFALHIHPFASEGVSVEEAISLQGPYQEYLKALAAATTDHLPVARLPTSGAPIDWPLLLSWLTRDQEARFAAVEDWRSARSESTSPNPPAADRGAVLRAVLGLFSDEEAALQKRWSDLDRSKDELDRRATGTDAITRDRRERLANKLGLPKKSVARVGEEAESLGEGLFDPAVARIEEHKKAAARAFAHLQEVEPQAAEAERAKEASARERDELAGQLTALKRLAQRRTLNVMGPPSQGRCNVPLAIARDRGCPLAEHPAEEPAHDPLTDLDFGAIAAAHAEAERAAAEAAEEARTWAVTLAEARGKVQEEQASLRDIERLVDEIRATEREAQSIARDAALRTSRMDTVNEQRAALRKAHQETRDRLSRRFESILKSLLGDQMGGEVQITRDGIEPIVKERGDRESAAMDTVGVIAFDLAALSLGFEGYGKFPGFLLHDGPREADMDQAIYDRIFLYARTLEEAFPSAGSIGFQYIVTTTTPPPASMRDAPWLLQPVLDASTPEGRLLRMDL
ncbi:MAG: hypothetical protein U0441_35930 [Polyangiaceae bacterium]